MNKDDLEIARPDLDDEAIQEMEDAIRDQENLLLKLKTKMAVKTKIADMKAKTAALNNQLPSASNADKSEIAKNLVSKVRKLEETLSLSPKCLTLIGVIATSMGMSMMSSQDTREQQIKEATKTKKQRF